ncbi:MAG: hypothetical protein HYR85_21270 [Planctomycetes bacterium]|nr:hypothetical protein [Planctomycetota bacterium]MBI3847110.1 hypothetical protein [Planctomycetota bacterium]
MKSTRVHLPILALASALALAIPVSAGIFMRTDSPEDTIKLWKLDEPPNQICYGRVLEKRILPVTLPDSGDVEMTLLTIGVIDRVTAAAHPEKEPAQVLAMYRGGSKYRTSAQPEDDETDVGVEGVFLLTSNPYPDVYKGALWIAGLNSVFRVRQNASHEAIAMGKGSGMAIAQDNTRVDSFLDSHRAALAEYVRVHPHK